MMTKTEQKQNNYEFVLIEDLVPEEHLVRKLDKYIDYKFIYKVIEPYYCHDNGRASIDPVVLFKIIFISYIFGVRLIRQNYQRNPSKHGLSLVLGIRNLKKTITYVQKIKS